MKRLAIIGAGELAEQIVELLDHCKEQYVAIGYFDDSKQTGSLIKDIPVLGKTDEIDLFYNNNVFDYLIIAVGYKHMQYREKLVNKFEKQIPFATLIHKSCIVHPTVEIGSGCILYAGCIIDKNVKLGDNVLLNLGVVISHDTHIGDNSFFAPRVAVSGFVKFAKNCFIGTNATIIDNLKIGDNVTVGAGSVVIKSIGNNSIVIGNPAKVIQQI